MLMANDHDSLKPEWMKKKHGEVNAPSLWPAREWRQNNNGAADNRRKNIPSGRQRSTRQHRKFHKLNRSESWNGHGSKRIERRINVANYGRKHNQTPLGKPTEIKPILKKRTENKEPKPSLNQGVSWEAMPPPPSRSTSIATTSTVTSQESNLKRLDRVRQLVPSKPKMPRTLHNHGSGLTDRKARPAYVKASSMPALPIPEKQVQYFGLSSGGGGGGGSIVGYGGGGNSSMGGLGGRGDIVGGGRDVVQGTLGKKGKALKSRANFLSELKKKESAKKEAEDEMRRAWKEDEKELKSLDGEGADEESCSKFSEEASIRFMKELGWPFPGSVLSEPLTEEELAKAKKIDINTILGRRERLKKDATEALLKWQAERSRLRLSPRRNNGGVGDDNDYSSGGDNADEDLIDSDSDEKDDFCTLLLPFVDECDARPYPLFVWT